MRQPTDSELAKFQAWQEYAAKYATKPNHIWPFDHGFDAGCAHSAERIAALGADNARLRDQLQAMLNVFDPSTRGYPLPEGSIARYACDEARQALDNT